jgi:DNA-binding CsgD family transcriptional regulator
MRAQLNSSQPSPSQPWLRTLSTLFACVDSTRFPAELERSLRSVVPVDRVLVYAVRREQAPLMLHGESSPDSSAARAERLYFAGGYGYDPYYRAFLAGQAGGFCADAQGFDPSLRWQRVEHVAYLSPVSPQVGLVALLVRSRGSRVFSAAELRRLSSLEDAVVSALRLHWTTCAERRAPARGLGGRELNHRVDAAIEEFGRSVLTPRETEVVQLLLRGNSTKAAAARLGIAVATTALHRKRTYAKLGVSSQAELFYLFLCSLSQPEPTRLSARSRDVSNPREPRSQPGWSVAVSEAS